jgi:hypothetical protein
MKPTAYLRFVLRRKKLILQQWWSEVGLGPNTPGGEWRDVAVEKE